MLKRYSYIFITLGITLMIPQLLTGQNSSSTSSVYSRFGFGSLSGNSFGRGDGLGGIGIGTRNSFQINTANPASYTSIDSLTFLMQVGLDAKFTNAKSASSSRVKTDVNFNHMTYAIPLTRWWSGAFGLIPFSNKGYDVSAVEGVEQNVTQTSFSGTGTMTKLFVGNGFRIGKNISVGFNTWFLFGKISDNTYIYYPNDVNAYDYLKDNSLTAHGFGFSTGFQYYRDFKNQDNLTIGLVFEPSQKIASKYIIHEERVLFRSSSSNTPIVDTLQHVESTNNGLSVPMSYGAGFSYSFKKKLKFGADYRYEKWKDVLFLGTSQSYLTNSSRYGIGFEYVPNLYSIRSYWERTEYRMGAFYENSYLYLNGSQINGYGLTFGIGLPLSRSRSALNISAELGQLGTTQNNLIKESYAKFTFHFLLHDRWFFKRKFD